MNNQRRKQIQKSVIEKIEAVRSELESIQETLSDLRQEEEDCMLNMPENLQGSERYQRCEDAVGSMEDADSGLEDALSTLEDTVATLTDMVEQ